MTSVVELPRVSYADLPPHRAELASLVRDRWHAVCSFRAHHDAADSISSRRSNIYTNAREFGGKNVRIPLEDDAIVTERGLEWFYSTNRLILLIK